ncbi:MAG: hypothetical protein IJB11_00960 [Oscillospiraceae bacterium]|nr:hypothetical protein [Oscillospiraceae bacterium]
MEYDIRMGRDVIGKVNVERQGLYYHFSCRCRLSGTVIYRVVVTGGGHSENLGVLVPVGDVFGLEKKVAVKHLGTGELRFQAMPKHQKAPGEFVPIRPEEPFAYITRLQDAFMEIRDGQIGVVV